MAPKHHDIDAFSGTISLSGVACIQICQASTILRDVSVSTLERGAPEEEHADSVVTPAGGGAAWEAGDAAPFPQRDPRRGALLEFRDDAPGDGLIDIADGLPPV